MAQFRKRRAKQWNKGCRQGGNPYAMTETLLWLYAWRNEDMIGTMAVSAE